MQEMALRVLSADRLSYADMIDCIRQKKANILYFSPTAVLIEDVTCGICALAATEKEEGVKALSRLDRRFAGWIVAHGEMAREATYAVFPIKDETKTVQVAYCKDPFDFSPSLSFASPSEKELQAIKDGYDRESPENIQKIYDKGELFSARDREGNFVGFIGFHPEGSMGLLYIFPDYRRQGYAEETEKFLMTECFRRGKIPYGHVVYGNEASMHLQKKLGFEAADQYAYWLRQ